MKATVLYYSRRGKTAGYAREIAMYLWSKGLDVSLSSLTDYDPEKLSGTDFLFTGCWTCGWFVIGQHPHRRWKEFSRKLSGVILVRNKLPGLFCTLFSLLFTTYKFRTGSLFGQMKKTLHIPRSVRVPCLSSKTGFLTKENKELLDQFIHS